MNNNVEKLINEAVNNMIKHTSSDKKINKLIKKHDKKVHFIPKKYRIFGGVLQSLNIQFGNFIEELMEVIIANDDRYEIVKKYSGKKSNKFKISSSNESLIDNYITRCQTESDFALETEFIKLINSIINDNGSNTIEFKHDIDLLFKDKNTGIYYYLEIKYEDNHDTGKFIDINRKFIKTSAYLINELKIDNIDMFKPILFFFNNRKMKGNIYIPENTNIYRGKRFFDEYLNINYDEVEQYMLNLSENDSTIKMFNELYDKVMNYKK